MNASKYTIYIYILKVGEGRALYNLGNVFHAKGKHLGRLGQQDPGEFPEDVRNCLQTAVNYYELVTTFFFSPNFLVFHLFTFCDHKLTSTAVFIVTSI